MATNMASITQRLRIALENKRERQTQARLNARRIAALEQWIPKQSVGAELGVHKGYFSRVLFDAFEPRTLYLIDSWYLTEGAEWSWGLGNRSTTEGISNVLRTMGPELVSRRAELIIASDLEALEVMDNAHLDWAYIDTSHQYAHTIKELELLKSKVKSTGVIAGDDWREDPSHRHHGVCRAVREFVEREKFQFLLADTKSAQWVIRKGVIK
jgi:Methyltransferase domain